jgi:hypothetical protein
MPHMSHTSAEPSWVARSLRFGVLAMALLEA